MESRVPYWTADIGGFVSGNPDDPAYRELFVRWFQYGTFCPTFRVHATRTNDQNELWSYGPEAQEILTSFDRLRYRLMPYIYGIAWRTTGEAHAPMRPLVMDFLADIRVHNIGDQFMFGPAILVNPVTEPGTTSRRIYLPKTKWYDFWTGKAALSTLWLPSTAFPCTSVLAPSCPWVLTCSRQLRSRPIPSRCVFTAEQTAASRSMKTKTTPTTTRKVCTQPSACAGTMPNNS